MEGEGEEKEGAKEEKQRLRLVNHKYEDKDCGRDRKILGRTDIS